MMEDSGLAETERAEVCGGCSTAARALAAGVVSGYRLKHNCVGVIYAGPISPGLIPLSCGMSPCCFLAKEKFLGFNSDRIVLMEFCLPK